jgi:hypothetical protein
MLDTVKAIIHLRASDRRARYQDLRDALRTLDGTAVRALLAEGLADHDRAILSAQPLGPWLHGPDDPGLELVLWVAQVRPDACDGLPAELWRRRVFGHGVLYRNADAATRDALLAEVDAALDALVAAFADLTARPPQWGSPGLAPAIRERLGALTRTREWRVLNVALRMVAWIGDGTVQRWFHTRRTALPAWDSLFYLSADAYVSEGGWALTPAGGRRELAFPIAYQLVAIEEARDERMASREPGHTSSRGEAEPVAVMTPHEGRCRWCGRRLTVLLDLDLRHPALAFLGLDGTRLRLVMCEECSLWNRLYMDVDLMGAADWSTLNAAEGETYPGDELLFTPPTHHLGLGPRCASAVEVAARGDGWDVSQLGGLPSWVQDADYALCPACHRRMTFVGQVTPEVVSDRAIDGVLYGLLCLECLRSTVIYQCT